MTPSYAVEYSRVRPYRFLYLTLQVALDAVQQTFCCFA